MGAAGNHSIIFSFVSTPKKATTIAAITLMADMKSITYRTSPVRLIKKLVKYGAIMPAVLAITPEVPFPNPLISVG
ncbi:protein of unknown function [Mesotoga infera]|uniref:Uncharacterized protein n=1 Tax=Mesotoga infera TaxID=1236046 RepID=A0A7Z7LGZ7_9BACT|nr:protein of unknown function [Mesotoga infera]